MYFLQRRIKILYMILSNFSLLIVLSFKFRVVRLRNGLTALLISNLEEANNDDMKYKDCKEGCSSAKRVKRDVWKV